MRRSRHHTGSQGELFPAWQYHAFVTDRPGTAIELDGDHRRHAVVELAIRDLKAGAGLAHLPSGKFNANAAWLVIATLAHNLIRWVAALGLAAAGTVVAKTVRRTLLALPGRLTRSARRWTLHLPPAGHGRSASPTRWPGCTAFRIRPDRPAPPSTSPADLARASMPVHRPARPHQPNATTQARNPGRDPTAPTASATRSGHSTAAVTSTRRNETLRRWIQAQFSLG